MSLSVKLKHADFSATNAQNSGAMKTLNGLSSVQKALKKGSQKQAFYDALKRNKTDNIDKTVKMALGELMDANGNISQNDIKKIGRELIKNGKIIRNKTGVSGSSGKISGHPIMERATARIMERRAQSLNNTSAPLNQTQATPARIPTIGNYGMRSKVGGISPSFGAGSRPAPSPGRNFRGFPSTTH